MVPLAGMNASGLRTQDKAPLNTSVGQWARRWLQGRNRSNCSSGPPGAWQPVLADGQALTAVQCAIPHYLSAACL